ncbi:bacterio-opsin activator [Metallosphaera hakonensis JCM 8857 = DSM 7519]|uniref:Bacterio-opsin activator n=2 Tax=Metallosphaera hakonensis TaxID=79601 RepID=A0A2U9IX27_9CREN|nr:bacterio-opsin activator [Metallosphaera hakonensis JCM 8857 = DSM 7519]
MTISVQHQGCWTSDLDNVDASTLNYQVYPDRDYLRSRITLYPKDRAIISRMRKSNKILRINKVTSYNDVYFIDFLNRYRDSLAGWLYDKEVMFLFNRIWRGIETWGFAVTSDRTSEILREVSSYGKLMSYTLDDFKIDLGPRLSPAERRTLVTAFHRGYLDYPRRVDADTVANELGLSKVTFLHHLRNAYRKLTTHYLNSERE